MAKRNLVNTNQFLTNSGSLIINIWVKARSMLSIASLSGLSSVMRLFNHVGGAHDLTVLVNLLKDVYVGVVLQIHF
jgi:hypothetical protein